MQYDASILMYKLGLALTASATVYFTGLWIISRFVPDFSQEQNQDEEV